MEGLDKSYGVQYNVWYKNILGDKFMVHHDSHKGSLFVSFIVSGNHPRYNDVDLRITNVFEREDG